MSSESTTIDADANVPLWVNIVVPMATVSIFLIVIVLLWRTDKEIPYVTIRRWVSKMPYINKWLLGEKRIQDLESISTVTNQKVSYTEHSEINKTIEVKNKSYGTLDHGQTRVF